MYKPPYRDWEIAITKNTKKKYGDKDTFKIGRAHV